MENKGKIWTQKDFDFLISNYPIYGAEYCAIKLERNVKAVIAQANRIKLKSKKIKLKYFKENLEPIVKESKSIREVICKLKLGSVGGNHKTIKKYIEKYNIDMSHFETANERVRRISKLIPLEDILLTNSNYNRTHLKDRLYKIGLKKRECELCGQGEMWKGKKMSLIIDHINGVNNDNRLENLRIVCPNCNATLETHCGKHKRKNKDINYVDGRESAGIKKRKFFRPPLDQLKKEVKEYGYSRTGRKYGVSDNSIRKWIKSYEKKLV